MSRRVRWGARLAVGLAVLGSLLVAKRAPATVAEQRARLPPPAVCEDPVAGMWRSHKYDPRYGDWTIFSLDIRRVQGSETELEGTIHNHSWDAGPTQEEPGPCQPGAGQWMVSMDARGRVSTSGEIFFGGIGQWRLDQVICNFGPGGYNLDNFTGVIDSEIQEFQSVNNDGGRAVNEPTVFRRVSCYEAPPAPHVITQPPPFYPDMAPSGCGC